MEVDPLKQSIFFAWNDKLGGKRGLYGFFRLTVQGLRQVLYQLADLFNKRGERFCLFQAAHQGAADDDAIHMIAQHANEFRLADAETNTQGQIGLGPQPAKLIDESRRNLGTLPGDAGNADDVKETSRGLGDAGRALARSSRRHQVDELEIMG